MKKIHWFIAFVAICAMGMVLLTSYAKQRELAEKWPTIQMQNGKSLMTALNQYQEKEGAYPEKLRDLVEAEILTAQQFENLQFRERPGGEPVTWLYRKPLGETDVILAFSNDVHPWKGHSGIVTSFHQNGRLKVSYGGKKKNITHWVRERLPADAL